MEKLWEEGLLGIRDRGITTRSISVEDSVSRRFRPPPQVILQQFVPDPPVLLDVGCLSVCSGYVL